MNTLEANAWSFPPTRPPCFPNSSSAQLKDSWRFYKTSSQPQTLPNAMPTVHWLQGKHAGSPIYSSAWQKTEIMLILKEPPYCVQELALHICVHAKMCCYKSLLHNSSQQNTEHQLIPQCFFSICFFSTRKPSSTSESTPVLFPTTRTWPKFTDKVADDIIPAVKHSRAHFQENLLREQDDYMRNTHFRTTTFPYKDNIDYFSKAPIWNIWRRIQKRDFQECCLKGTLENCLGWRLRVSEQVVTVPPDQLELGSTEAPLRPCHAGNPCTKEDQY